MTSFASEVYLVKGDRSTREVLSSLLAAAGVSSLSFDSGTDFLEACDRLPPGCVVTSLQTEGMDAFRFLRRLGAEPISFPAIVIANEGQVLQAVEAMKAGANTVLQRPYADKVLLDAVRCACEIAAKATRQNAQYRSLDTLSRREQDVLRGLVAGMTNKTIGRFLAISPRTVETYRANVMTKACVGSVAELVRLSLGAKRWREAMLTSST